MTRSNFAKILDQLTSGTPFQRYTLELSNGSRLGVTHPEAVTLYHELVVHLNERGARSVFSYRAVLRFVETVNEEF